MYAPGEAIWSAHNQFPDLFVRKTGTSMASPLVAGLAARYLSEYPRATPVETRDALVCMARRGLISGLGPNSHNLLAHYYAATPALAPGRFNTSSCELST